MSIIVILFFKLEKVFACEEPVKYKTYLSSKDLQNSRGKSLESVGAIVQQDRANYHRFFKRDPGDEGDSILSDLKKRSELRRAIDRFISANDNETGWNKGYYGNEAIIEELYSYPIKGARVAITFWHCEVPSRAIIEFVEEDNKIEVPEKLEDLPPPPPQ